MATQYPASIDDTVNLPTLVDGITPIDALVINRLRDTIITIEEELGVKPSSIYTNVRTRLDNMEGIIASLKIISLDKDLGGTLAFPQVVGIRGTPISSLDPALGQVLKFNGIAWVPSTVASTSTFSLGGDLGGTEFSQLVIGLQGRPLLSTLPNMGDVVIWDGANWGPGTVNSFTAAGDLSGTNTNQNVIKVNGVPFPGSIGSSGQVLSVVAGVVTWVPQMPHTFEISLITGLQSSNVSTYDRRGGRKIDMSLYPATIGAYTRTVTFVAAVQKTSAATSVDLQLYDVTHSVQVTTLSYSTNTDFTEITTSALTVGSSSGNIRDDVSTLYEVDIRMTGGSIAVDAVYCTSARLVITYA